MVTGKSKKLFAGVGLVAGILAVGALGFGVSQAVSNGSATATGGQQGTHGGTTMEGGISGMAGQNGMLGMSSQGGMTGMSGHSRLNGSGAAMTMDVVRHFIEQMIPHHEDAVTMSDLALKQAEHPELKQLATTIKQTQSAEIKQMQDWYKQWYGTDVPASTGMSMGQMQAVDGAKPFDKAFIEAMVPHHEQAVMMSTMALQSVDRPEFRIFLQNIITTQTAEIEQMRLWYQQWYGTALPEKTGMNGHLGMGMNMGTGSASAERQSQVARNGALVMPFDLTRTTHFFTDTETGGREVVTANDPADIQQIDLIHSHLKGLVPRFSSGDFSNPAAIHGDDMPGLAQLRAGYNRIEFIYEELPNGAALTYRTSDPVMVSVLHTWFEAQRGDHGAAHQGGPVETSE
jgi:uncharacterized protein (DUF305 family)